MVYLNRDRYNQIDIANQQLSETLQCVGPFSTPDPRWDFGKLYEARGLARTSVSQTFTQTLQDFLQTFTQTLPDFIFCGHQNRTGAIMGVRQSSPMAESRTRAYSSPVPSSGGSTTPVFRYTAGPGGPQIHYTGWNRPSSYHQINVTHGGRSRTDVFGNSLDQEEPDWERGEHQLMIGSLPLHLSPNLLGGFHCPVCSKFLVSDEMEIHLIMCLTKPRLAYNEDVLEKDSEECAICLDEMEQGDTIARLPCLCIYHKGCIDEWFEVNRSCPEHPSD